MSDADRLRWDGRYATLGPVDVEAAALPAVFTHCADEFPTAGKALDLACGQGGTSVWLARRGLRVWGVDASPVAIDQARELADRCEVLQRCRFSVVDLDDGLPVGEPMDAIVCHRFRAPQVYPAIVALLAPGGLLAISVLSEVGADPGLYRAPPGELIAAFAELELIAAGEGDGIAWVVARRAADR
jgi:2-polyprenyl-3-methyl-5-hydroxy-6-metoxy-1,4-benzoquinol methylase